jgi:hypothetical protein
MTSLADVQPQLDRAITAASQGRCGRRAGAGGGVPWGMTMPAGVSVVGRSGAGEAGCLVSGRRPAWARCAVCCWIGCSTVGQALMGLVVAGQFVVAVVGHLDPLYGFGKIDVAERTKIRLVGW